MLTLGLLHRCMQIRRDIVRSYSKHAVFGALRAIGVIRVILMGTLDFDKYI